MQNNNELHLCMTSEILFYKVENVERINFRLPTSVFFLHDALSLFFCSISIQIKAFTHRERRRLWKISKLFDFTLFSVFISSGKI